MKNILLSFIILFSLCSNSYSSGEYDGVGSGSVAVSGTPSQIDFAVTQTNSNEPCIYFFVSWCDIIGLIVANDTQGIVTPTADGNAMTYITGVVNGTHYTNVYYYKGLTGSTNIHVEWENLDNPGSATIITGFARAITAYNIDQTTAVQASGVATGTTSPITKALTTNNALNLLIDSAEAHAGVVTLTASGTGQTQRFQDQVGSKGGYMRVADSTKQATAASDTMSYTESINRVWGQVVVEAKGTSGAVASTFDPYMSGEDGLY